MRNKSAYVRVACAVLGIVAALIADGPNEAPAGFETPTLSVNPGSQSNSNGIEEPQGDTYALDQSKFEMRHDASNGLGPLYNATACAECHQNVVSGAASQNTEIRAGHKDANGNFVNPTIPINGGGNTVTGRSIVNDRAICEAAMEHLPDTETVHTLRATLSTLGDGFVEAVDDRTLQAIAANQPFESGGMIHGEAILIPVLESPGQLKVGRFGWKDQQPSVLSFAGDAYLNEMGVTNRVRPNDVTSVCKTSQANEDPPDDVGLSNIDHFAQFIRGTKAPPRDTVLAATADAQAGHAIFQSLGCPICHVETLTTDPPGTLVTGGNGGTTYRIPAALGGKIFHPFGDYLLHDVGTGDGIVQAGPADTANKLRTAPLWGLHIKSRFMHDLASPDLTDAIQRHAGEAQGVTANFIALPDSAKAQLITFLKSL